MSFQPLSCPLLLRINMNYNIMMEHRGFVKEAMCIVGRVSFINRL
ncbi:hypothetical protein BDE02_07G030900 [Populus trichocarpa]|nr:hypothetical protein BDE02_07G030900 [Populus trichocarpa]